MSETAALIVAVGGAVAVLAGWWRWVRPRAKKAANDIVAVRDTLVGREAVRDSITGKEIAPAVPGIGVRQANLEQQMTVLADAVSVLAHQGTRLDEHESAIADLRDDVSVLQSQQQERIAARIESAQAWKAMEAAHNADPADDEDADG